MRFGRHLSNTLEGETNTYLIKMRMSAKEAVEYGLVDSVIESHDTGDKK